jgi:hypothetical protein
MKKSIDRVFIDAKLNFVTRCVQYPGRNRDRGNFPATFAFQDMFLRHPSAGGSSYNSLAITWDQGYVLDSDTRNRRHACQCLCALTLLKH